MLSNRWAMGKGQELLVAAREGDLKNVEKILGQITKRSGPFPSLRRGAGVNVQDDNGYTALHHACLHRHKEIVRLLLSVDASPCIADKKGLTPLHCASFIGDPEIVAMLLSHKNPPVNIDQQTSDQETALLMAAHFGHVHVVVQLMVRGANVMLRNNKDESALDVAAQYGRTETVQHLLRACPHLIDEYKYHNSGPPVFSTTPLHRASKTGHKDIVLSLINAGMDPNILAKEEGTPLHQAAFYGKTSVVRILLANGADPNIPDVNDLTVHDLLAGLPLDATRKVRRVIKEFESMVRKNNESEEDQPFPVSPTSYPNTTGTNALATQKKINRNESLSPYPFVSKNQPQSFVKKLASKCLGLKAKFNSAPNISHNLGLESETAAKTKQSDQKSNTNTLHIGNSKFFKILLKKEDSGEIVCNDEFDTISLDRLGTLNRDSVVNRSNRSCPGFKTSLPNISENTELSDSQESVVITEIDCNNIATDKKCIINEKAFAEAINLNAKLDIFEPRESDYTKFANSVNECYESYEFSSEQKKSAELFKDNSIPKPFPRPPMLITDTLNKETIIYENLNLKCNEFRPTPATRTHIPQNIGLDLIDKTYENISLNKEKKPEPFKRTFISTQVKLSGQKEISPSTSRSSTLSSDSMEDESNLEDILLSEKSKSFRHSNKLTLYTKNKKEIRRTRSYGSNESDSSDITEVSAMENVDCSDVNETPKYMLTGTLPNQNFENTVKKRILFRNKTFTNIDVDRNSRNIDDLPKWNCDFLKETLAHYHIRGTGHCMYKAPTVQEFMHIFNNASLYSDSVNKVENKKRESYFETAICFCRPLPPKHHKSAEDFLEIQDEEGKITIDFDLLKNRKEIMSTSFRCFCDSGICTLHAKKRESPNNFVVKFSAVKKSISTPNITLESSFSTPRKSSLIKNVSVPNDLESPYAIFNVNNFMTNDGNQLRNFDENGVVFTNKSNSSSISSSARPYSIRDIAEVISLNSNMSSDANQSFACDTPNKTLRKSSSSEYSGHWSLQSCNSNITIQSDASFKTCLEESSDEDSDGGTLHSEEETSDAETVKSDVSVTKRPWVHSDSFRFGSKSSKSDIIVEEDSCSKVDSLTKESGISLGSESSSSVSEEERCIPRFDSDVSLGIASLELGTGMAGNVRSGSGRRRWDETEGTSEGDALSISSAASSCAPHYLTHHHEYNKVSPTPPKKPPRRNLSVSPTHANSPSSGYSYELRTHARSQDDLDDIQGGKLYLKHGRSVDQYVDGKLSYSEYEENHNTSRIPVPTPRPSIKCQIQPVAITAMYENVVIKEQNPRRKLRRNNFTPQYENFEPRMSDNRVRKYSNQEKSSLESLLDSQSMNSPSDGERYYEGRKAGIPSSPTHYNQPPTPDHPPPSARQAENSIHERIRPLSQLIMEVVEEIRIRKKSQADISES